MVTNSKKPWGRAVITVHHLNNSRSQRILWLMEELELPYEVAQYQRDPVTRLAPPELKSIHPLGKSPVITDDGIVVIESAAIIDYVVRRYGGGRLLPAPGSRQEVEHLQWLHYAEGSAMLPLMLALYVGRLGEAGAPLAPRIDSETANHLGYMEASLGDKPYFLGDDLMAADLQLSFVVEAAEARGRLSPYPGLTAYGKRLEARPAYQRSIERGGPYTVGR
jgi:glutathione S-transferase